MKFITPIKTALMLLVAMLPLLIVNQAGAVDIQKFTTPKGIEVYLVENYTSPLITVSFSFEGGSSQDPTDKIGAARMLSTMLDEGSGDIKSKEFQAKEEELGVEIGFSAGRDYFTGTMQTLGENSMQAFELLRLAINEPRFDAAPIERMRQALLLGLNRSKTRPQSIAAKTLRHALFKKHPYANSTRGSIEGISAVQRNDLIATHRRLFVKSGLVIGVVGAINSAELAPVIDQVFASLPQKSDMQIVPEITPEFGQDIRENMDIAQTLVNFAFPGVKRSHPDFFAAYLANHILGGGTFSSRLYNEVREKRGLAYSVYSHIATNSHTAYTIVGSATSSKRVDETIKIIRDELKKMADKGPTAQELAAAKKYIIGSYAIRNLDTSLKVASVLVAIQQIDLGIDYIDKREAIIDSVSLEDVKRMANEMLKQKPTLVIVGPENS